MEQALDIAESVLSHINETIRDQEGRERLKVISQDLWVGQGYARLFTQIQGGILVITGIAGD